MRRLCAYTIVALAAVLTAASAQKPLEVYFINVDQGDAFDANAEAVAHAPLYFKVAASLRGAVE